MKMKKSAEQADMSKELIAYTDGSYNSKTGCYGCGAVLLDENEQEIKRFHKTGRPAKHENGWNVNGEIEAALMAVHAALELGCANLTICHDYEGVGNWPDGIWDATKSYTIEYAEKIKEFREKLDISFIHVKGHNGNHWNEIADEEAAIGANGGKPETAVPRAMYKNINPDQIEGMTDTCRKCLKTFFRTKKPSFKDFAKLRTGGIDKFSRMPVSVIEAEIGEEESAFIRERVHREQDYASAMRWRMRGLSSDDAAHKANVDGEINENAQKAGKVKKRFYYKGK